MDKIKFTLIIILIQTFNGLNGLKLQFEDGHFNFYEGFTRGNIRFEYFSRTEKNFRGNVTTIYTGEYCYITLTVLQQRGNTWDLYATFNRSYCDVWENEHYLTNQILEQIKAPKECPHPTETVFYINGYYFDTTRLISMIPTGVRFSKVRNVLEIDCEGQRAMDVWAIIVHDYTDEKKRRSKPGQKQKTKN